MKNVHPHHRRRSINSGSGGDIRKAYVNGSVSTSAIQACFLDTDTTGESVNVTCTICGGSDLSEASPRLANGILIYVTYDPVSQIWRCISPFQATEDCS